MADEITIQSQLRVNSVAGGLPPLSHQKNFTVDQTNKQKISLTLSCSTTTAAIDLSGLTAKGFTYFENTGTTNAVIVAIGTNDAFVIPPAAGYAVKLVTATSYVAKTAASTSTLVVEGYAD